METGTWSDAIESFSSALDVISTLRETQTGTDSYLAELASIHSWLRSAYLKTKAYQDARQQVASEISTWQAVLAADSGNYIAIRQLIVALRGQSELALISGDISMAAEGLEAAAVLAAQLIEHEADNTLNLEQAAHIHRQRAEIYDLMGYPTAASDSIRRCLKAADELVHLDPTNIWWEMSTCSMEIWSMLKVCQKKQGTIGGWPGKHCRASQRP